MSTQAPSSVRGTPFPQPAWVAFLDVYGFSAAVSVAESEQRLVDLLETIEKAQMLTAERAGSTSRLFFLSDNLFLVVPVSSHGSSAKAFRRVVADVRATMKILLGLGLPVRGAIAYGDVVMAPNVLAGNAVVRAVAHEKLVSLPVVFVPDDELRRADATDETTIKIDLPIVAAGRSGVISGAIIPPLNRSSFRRLAGERYRHHKVFGPPHVALAWRTVLDILVPQPATGL